MLSKDQNLIWEDFTKSVNKGILENIKKCFPVFSEHGLTPIEEKFFFALISKVCAPSIFREPTSFGKAGMFRVTDFRLLTSQRMFFSGKSKELYDKGFWSPFSYFFRSQFDRELEGKKMRLDFAFYIYDKMEFEPLRGAPGRPRLQVAIELDGHDFHEKTKEQAQKDKERDRILQHGGYKVLRYTGSEVWNGPLEVVDDVMHRVFGFIASDLPRPMMPYISSRNPWKAPEW